MLSPEMVKAGSIIYGMRALDSLEDCGPTSGLMLLGIPLFDIKQADWTLFFAKFSIKCAKRMKNNSMLCKVLNTCAHFFHLEVF